MIRSILLIIDIVDIRICPRFVWKHSTTLVAAGMVWLTLEASVSTLTGLRLIIECGFGEGVGGSAAGGGAPLRSSEL
jgi:hypothetical protein